MRQKIEAMTAAALLTLSTGLSMAAWAQAPTLAEQLAAQYKLVKMGSDSSGYAVVEEGTLLEVKKGGILGGAYKNNITRTATYQDGTVHSSDTAGKVSKISDKFCGFTHKCPTTPDAAKDEATTKLFKIGDKVYPGKIDVNLDKDSITMLIVACDTCNKTDPPTYNKVNMVFQFAKGSLAKASAGEVEDTIGQVFAISDSSSDQGGGDQGGQQGGGQQQGGQQQGGGQQAQQQQPQSIQMGMTIDQVVAAFGQPEKMVNLGPKQLYVYKDMKVTFINGRVADVN